MRKTSDFSIGQIRKALEGLGANMDPDIEWWFSASDEGGYDIHEDGSHDAVASAGRDSGTGERLGVHDRDFARYFATFSPQMISYLLDNVERLERGVPAWLRADDVDDMLLVAGKFSELRVRKTDDGYHIFDGKTPLLISGMDSKERDHRIGLFDSRVANYIRAIQPDVIADILNGISRKQKEIIGLNYQEAVSTIIADAINRNETANLRANLESLVSWSDKFNAPISFPKIDEYVNSSLLWQINHKSPFFPAAEINGVPERKANIENEILRQIEVSHPDKFALALMHVNWKDSMGISLRNENGSYLTTSSTNAGKALRDMGIEISCATPENITEAIRTIICHTPSYPPSEIGLYINDQFPATMNSDEKMAILSHVCFNACEVKKDGEISTIIFPFSTVSAKEKAIRLINDIADKYEKTSFLEDEFREVIDEIDSYDSHDLFNGSQSFELPDGMQISFDKVSLNEICEKRGISLKLPAEQRKIRKNTKLAM